MRVLFTGFTSRTVGSERNTYDYMSNVFVLEEAIKRLGHTVDKRTVSLITDPCIEEDYDVAVVGTAAANALNTRFKVGALWTLQRFGKRAGLFPSDGKNIGVFVSSVRSCLLGDHGDRTPFEYFLYGKYKKELMSVLDSELALTDDFQPGLIDVLRRLPHDTKKPLCDWPFLIPTHSWGSPLVYQNALGAPVITWDPTLIAIPMQFHKDTLAPDGRLLDVHTALANERRRVWIVSSLQDQSPWIKKMKCTWPVVTVGNKRAAREGLGDDYVPERQMIDEYYLPNWGHLAFGYPMADGGWWRMRYLHAAMAGIVTCCDPADARRMPDAYQHGRPMIERYEDTKLADIAKQQHQQLLQSALSEDHTLNRVQAFLNGLKG